MTRTMARFSHTTLLSWPGKFDDAHPCPGVRGSRRVFFLIALDDPL